jgi:hypothetical protein
MSDADNKLSPEAKERLKSYLGNAESQSLDKLSKACDKQTQYNFLVNSGGSAAVLAFLGTNTNSNFAIWPLTFFAIGLITCGVGLFAKVFLEGGTFQKISGIRSKLLDNSITSLKEMEIGDITKWYSYQIAKYANYTAFGAFIVGVIIGGITYNEAAPSGASN